MNRPLNLVVLGDSVVWGRYVTRPQTLSHYLNELAGKQRFANLGLNGAHPVALAGLLEYYGTGIAGKKVLLHYNPLWMGSPTTDLQEKDSPLNHPDLLPQFIPIRVHWSNSSLLPQFVPPIPANKAEASQKIGRLIDRNVPFTAWTNHLQQAYFDQTSIPRWTLEHPYANPSRQVTHGLPPSDPSGSCDPWNASVSLTRPKAKSKPPPCCMPCVFFTPCLPSQPAIS